MLARCSHPGSVTAATQRNNPHKQLVNRKHCEQGKEQSIIPPIHSPLLLEVGFPTFSDFCPLFSATTYCDSGSTPLFSSSLPFAASSSYAASPHLDAAPVLSPCLPFALPFPFQGTLTLLKNHHPPEPLSVPLAFPCRGQPGVHADGEPMAKWKRLSRKAPFPFTLQSSSNPSHTIPSQGCQPIWKGAHIPSLHPKTNQGLRPQSTYSTPRQGIIPVNPSSHFLWNH